MAARASPSGDSLRHVPAPSVSERMRQFKDKKKVAFIPFLCAGDPDLATTEKAVVAMDSVGAAVIELGVPYSDPVADGPVIQGASARAVARGTKLPDVLALVERVAPRIAAPLLLFVYYNQLAARGGIAETCRAIADAGARALLVPDIPLEETGAVREAAEAAGLELVLLTTPATPPERAARIAAATSGFLYIVSVAGVTGARASVSTRVPELIKELRQVTDVPLCVGFGISNAQQAADVASAGADGVIVGSALVRKLVDGGIDGLLDLAVSIDSAI